MREREPARMFVSYAEEDRAFFSAFEKHLAVLRRRGLVEVWDEGQLVAGADLDEGAGALIDRADVVVLLVSPDFAASDRCWEQQLGRALARHARGEAIVLPVRLRAVVSDGAPFEGLRSLPRDGAPIGEAENDEAWAEVAAEIAARLEAAGRERGRDAHRTSTERPDDFQARVERLCRLREGKEPVRCRAPAPFAGLWEIEVSADPIEVKPIAALDGPANIEALIAFDELLDARYRDEDPQIRSMLVYRGAAAREVLVRDARRRGVALTSFDALNRLIDFGGYLERLREKLANDPVYPQSLYIEQRGFHVVARSGREVPNALDEIWTLVTDPQPRFILVLADFGTGKTFLLRQLAARLAEPKSPVVPILVELRALEKARSLDVLLTQHFTLAGERSYDLDRFFHMLEQGKVALLFDGFDELVPRVTFDRAAEHLETLIEAARGRAKVVITSRTQHFLSDRDVEQALARRAERVPQRQMFKLLPFSDDQIRDFLVRKLGSEAAATRRFELLGQVTDLLGLSHNPRMLSFIVEIDEQKLFSARDRSGAITKAGLYTLLVERWIDHEFHRAEYKGVPTLLNPPDRWRAVLVLAERMWGSSDKGLDLREMPDDLRDELVQLGPPDQDAPTKAQHAASGTLLVRDEEGRFSFLHRSILEFAAAWAAALALRLGKTDSRLLTSTEMTDLMAEFFGDLATPENAVGWAQPTLEGQATAMAKKNAQRVLARLSPDARPRLVRIRVVRREESLRGENLAGQDLRGADFSASDLSEVVLRGADLKGASLASARLVRADLGRSHLRNADLRGADLSFARLSGADLRGAKLEGALFRAASLIGARLDPDALDSVDVSGACPPVPTHVHATVLPTLRTCRSISISPDGALLASCHSGCALVLWELATGDPIRVWTWHEHDILDIAFSPDGLTLAAASNDGSVRLFRSADGACLRVFRGHESSVYSVAFSPDGLTIASGSEDGTVCLWRGADGADLHLLKGHSRPVTSVAFSADGLTLASGSNDYSARLWRVADGASLHVLRGHSSYVTSVAFSPDGLTLASGSYDDSIRLWRTGDGSSLLTLRGHSSTVYSVVWSPDGLTLASGSHDYSIRLWRIPDGACLRTLKGHSSFVTRVAFSPDGFTLASGSDDDTLRIWRVHDGAPVRVLRGQSRSAASVAFSPDGAAFASTSDDGAILLWQVRGRVSRRTFRRHSSSVSKIVFSPDGLTLASASYDKTVRLWSVADGTPTRTLRGHADHVVDVAFSRDGVTLASASSDGTIRVWRAADGTSMRMFEGPAADALAFSPDGLTLASGDTDGVVRLRRTDGARPPISALTGFGWIRSLAFSPDGLTLASGTSDYGVFLWQIERTADPLVLQRHSGAIESLAFSPDGRLIASGSYDRSVRLWRVADGACLHVLQGHSDSVEHVAFSPDGHTFASSSIDNSIRLWRVADGRCLAVLYATETGWVAFTPGGRYKLSGDLRGSFWHVVGLCRFEPGELDEYLPHLRMADDEPLFTP